MPTNTAQTAKRMSSPSNPLQPPAEHLIELSFSDDIPDDWIDSQLLVQWAKNALEDHMAGAEVDIRICGEQEMADLNRRFAGKDYPTNVLSFPAGDNPAGPMPLLGDVVICAPVTDREAADQGKSRPQHLAHLLSHGVLHLLGFDHEDDQDAAAMEAEERRLLSQLGYPDPYLQPLA